MTKKFYLELRNTDITESLLKFYANKVTSTCLNNDTFVLEVTDLKQKIIVEAGSSLTPDNMILKFYQRLQAICKDIHKDCGALRKEISKYENRCKR